MKNGFVKNQRAHDLYVNKPLLKAILIVIIPSLAMTFMTGIYIFTSQLLINRLVPIAHGGEVENFYRWFGVNMDTIKDQCKDAGVNFYGVGDVVKGAMSISSPIATIIGSSPFFLAGGAAVLFTQAMGRESKYKASQVFKTSFYMVLVMALALTTILLLVNKPILTLMSAPAESVAGNQQLTEYFQKVHDLQISFANDYLTVYSASIILPLFIFYLASLIKSEGRFKVVVITSILCNLLNIALIVIFVLFAGLGMIGGALGSTVSYGVNLIVLLIYLIHLNRSKQTWLSFKLLFKPNETKIRLNLIGPIILIGLSAFLIDISYAVANMFYIPILANTALKIYEPAAGNGMYFQTIEGATMPILNLVFITIYGIVDGERLIISYNYSIGNWKRITKTYRYTIFISFIYSVFMVIILAFACGKPILGLFDINGNMMSDAYYVLLIQLLMLPAFSFQAPAMSIYMSIADTVRSNIAAVFQDSITFFPTLGICYGISIATGNIWILVSTYVINAIIASSSMISYTEWWIRHRFGRIKVKSEINGIVKTDWIPTDKPKPSFIQTALERD